MTVKQLKEFLENIPDDYTVEVDDSYNQTYWKLGDETEIIIHKESKTIVF